MRTGNNKERGAVMIELSIVVIVIIFIGLAGFEVTSVMKYKQFSLQLSKELANAVFRDCPDVNESLTIQCLNTRSKEIYDFAQVVVPNAFVYVTLWYKRPGDPLLRSYSWPAGNADDPTPVMDEKCNLPTPLYAAGKSKAAGANKLLNTVMDMTVVAEAYVPYSPTFDALAKTLGLKGCYFYDATII